MTTQPVGNERPRGRLARLFEAAGLAELFAEARELSVRTVISTWNR